ncbi:MAG: MATE family efflux transporter, partial [Burkholderiaceae bacterium]
MASRPLNSAAPARLVTGSTLRHVLVMTFTSAFGLVSVFAVEALSLFYVGLLHKPELTAAMGYSGTLLFFATSVSIGLSIAGTALTARALGRGDLQQAREVSGAALTIMLVVMSAFACLVYPLLETLAYWL